MGLQIGQLPFLQNIGGQIPVLDPVIGQYGRGKPPVQIHLGQAGNIFPGQGVVALPQGL